MEDPTSQISQTTQGTNATDSSYPILFQLQTASERRSRNLDTDTVLSTPYTTRKGTAHTQFMKRVRISMALVGIFLIVMVIFVLSFYIPDSKTKNSNADVNKKKIPGKIIMDDLVFNSAESKLIINNSFSDLSIVMQMNSTNSEFQVKKESESVTLQQNDLLISMTVSMKRAEGKCWKVYSERNENFILQSCIDMSGSHWFGLGEIYQQTFQLENVNLDMMPFVSQDLLSDKSKVNKKFGGILDPYLLSSKGIAIFIDRKLPINVSINSPVKNQLCFRSRNAKYQSQRLSKRTGKNQLDFTICMAKDIKEVHKIMLGKFFERSLKTPDEKMLVHPVWSTWARYKANVTQEKVLSFVQEIKNHKMPINHVEIDDKYSTTYGDFNFDKSKFPDASSMIRMLHSNGTRVTAWVYPFANLDSKALSQGADFWVKSGKVPGVVKWWNGYGTVLDTTNKDGVLWFQNRLKNFKNTYELDGFKFDAGEVEYLPANSNLNKSLGNMNYFSEKYVTMASEFGGLTEVRVGYGCQKYPIFSRIIDRSSTWGYDNGLKSVLTATLTLGILGYPFVLPDMVGGNAYNSKPDKELFIRWTQLSVFLPSIQFSITPWDYDSETVEIVCNALKIRQNISSDLIKFAKVAASTGVPIIRPVWWQVPSDKQALGSSTEFMLGDKYLVAPVMVKGAQARTVHLVNGTWQEMFDKRNIITAGEYGRTLQYNVQLKDVLYFKNLFSSET